MIRFLVLVSVLTFGPLTAVAQSGADEGELANIRQELSQLYAEILGLRAQLNAEAQQNVSPELTGPSILRLDRLEADLQATTGKLERLSFRIQQIVDDGTRRIGDLEFRLVELEGGDLSSLGKTPTLGGEVQETPPKQDVSQASSVQLAVAEESDFDAAQQSLGDGQYANAILRFSQFLADYPGGPLSARALFHMGEAHEAMGEHKLAARSYLDSFTAQPNGAYSAQSLMRVGVSLGNLGKADNACQTLNEVLIRYPNSEVVSQTQENKLKFGCQ